jgi:hypothetical protein
MIHHKIIRIGLGPDLKFRPIEPLRGPHRWIGLGSAWHNKAEVV